MRKQFKQLISIILAAVITVQSCPFNVSAADSIAADDTAILETGGETYEVTDSEGKPSEVVVGEVSTLREESVKHFRMEDGSFVAINYGLPVHYSTDGETWENIDNTLISTASSGDGDVAVMSQVQTSSDYTAENGDRTTTFSGDLSNGFLFSSSRGQVGIVFALPGGDNVTNEDEEIIDEPIIDLIPIESEPTDLSGEKDQNSTAVTPETETTEEPTEATAAPTEMPTEESNEAITEPSTEPIESEESEYTDEIEASVIETIPDETISATLEPEQTDDSPAAIEDNFVEETTEAVVAEETAASGDTTEETDTSEPVVESEPTENIAAETEEPNVGEDLVAETEAVSSTETPPSVTDEEVGSSEIPDGEESTPTESAAPADETEPSQESTEATEPTDPAEETISSDETIPTETEEAINDPAEIVIEETDVVIRQYDRTVVAQISYPDQENTELDTGDASTMGITQGNSSSDEEPDLMDQVYPEKLRTNILYEDVYPGVDLLYEMYSVHVKESIIVKEKLDDYSFTFQLSLDGLTPVLQNDGSINLVTENEEAIYWIPAPCMYDATGAESASLFYSVELIQGDQWLLTVTPDVNWIESDDRIFPVTIDPTLLDVVAPSYFVHSLTSENSTSVTGKTNIACGYHPTYGLMETYFKLELPTIAPGNTVVRSYVSFNQNDFLPTTAGASVILYMSKVTENVTLGGALAWGNRPDLDDHYLDYAIVTYDTMNDNIMWDITEAVKSWYDHGNNYGLAMTSNANSTTKCRAWFTYNSQVAFIVSYRNTNGLEPYYTYQTADVGNAGTVYIADYSGNVTVSKNLVSYASTINPVSIEMVYNSSYPSSNHNVGSMMGLGMNVGAGWQLNIMQKIVKENLQNDTATSGTTTYLKYIDGDGTNHYFAKDASRDNSYYYDEDGLGLRITEYTTGSYKMYDDNGNVMTFTNGILNNITDANGNQIQIIFSKNSSGLPAASGDKIRKVVQLNAGGTAITVATFTYDSSNKLNTVTDAAGNVYTMSYYGNYITSMKRNETMFVQYTYPYEKMEYAYDTEAGYGIAFTYGTGGLISGFYEINSASTASKPGAVISVNRLGYRQTVYRNVGVDQESDIDDIFTYYTFDYAGRTVNCYLTDSDKNLIGATNAVYSGTGSTAKDNNRTLRTATIGATAVQLLGDAGFESVASEWSVSSGATIGTNNPKTGTKGYIGTSSSASASRTVTLTTTGLYTISGYVNTSAATINSASYGVYIEVLNSSNTQVAKTNLVHYKTSADIENGWVRVSDTFTATAGTYTVRIRNNGVTGSVYVDDLLLEKGEAASNVNLLENGNFESGISDWTHNGGSLASTSGIESSKALKITGEPNTGSYAAKTVTLNKSGKYTYVLSGWGKGHSVPDTTGTDDWEKAFGIRAKINYSDGTNAYQFAPFNTDVDDWQFTSVAIIPNASKTVSSITVVCGYEKNANYAYFDNLSLVMEPAQTMTYYSNGELKSVATSGSSTNTYSYSGSDLIKAVTEGSGTFNYTYDSKHNLKTATNGIVTQSYGYSSAGNLTSTTLTGSSTSAKITSSAAYSTDGNQLLKTTDSRNNSITYAYEQNAYMQHGVPTQVTDATSVARRTIIDTIGRPTSEYIASTISLTYAYTKGMLSQVDRGGWIPGDANKKTQSYVLSYDTMGRLSGVKIGENSGYNLVTNAYNRLGCLTEQVFGNGDSIEYEYDSLGRVTDMTKIGDEHEFTEYAYSSDGKLSMIKNGGNVYRYVYDNLDRLISSDWIYSTGSGTAIKLQTYHEYDTSNRLTKQIVNLVDKIHTQMYNYDGYGRFSGMSATINSTSNSATNTTVNSTTSVAYDGLSRLGSVTKQPELETYTYIDGADSGTSTNLVKSITYTARNNSFNNFSLSYSYDNNGNITAINGPGFSSQTASYAYDPQGQLTGESNYKGTYKYVYDTYGNICSVNNASNIPIHTYKYENSKWLDLLTEFDSHDILYEGQLSISDAPASGNPIQYYNGTQWYFDWDNGHELVEATNSSGTTITYEYDMNGVRTSKNVNGVVHDYIYAGGLLVRESYSGNVIDFIYDQNGNPYAMIHNNTVYYYVLNLQGDVIRVVKPDGTLMACYAYNAWGQTVYTWGTMVNTNPLRYRGYYWDSESGFYYLQSRYYDPQIGRFINADKCLLSQYGFLGYNLFSYCLNNPVNYRDDCGCAPVPTLFDYYRMHKGVQQKVVWDEGYAMEVYVSSPNGIGFLDLYDPYRNQYYEVKVSTANPEKTENQMARYDSSTISSWMFEGYFFIGSLTRGTNSSIEGSFYYKDWLVEYGYVAPGLIMYNYAPNDNAGVTQPFVIPVIIPAGSYSGNPGKNYGNYDYRLI